MGGDGLTSSKPSLIDKTNQKNKHLPPVDHNFVRMRGKWLVDIETAVPLNCLHRHRPHEIWDVTVELEAAGLLMADLKTLYRPPLDTYSSLVYVEITGFQVDRR